MQCTQLRGTPPGGCRAAPGGATLAQAEQQKRPAHPAAWGGGAQVRLPPAAKDLIQRLLCDVDDRLGTAGGAAEVKARTRPAPPGTGQKHPSCCAHLLLFVFS